MRRRYTVLMSTRIVEALTRQRLFRSMEPDLIEELAAGARFVDLRGGAVLFEPGAQPDAMYLVVTGRLRVELPDGQFSDVGVDESVGDISVITNEVRTDRVIALRDSHLIRLQRQELLNALRQHPQSLLDFGRIEIQRIRARRFDADQRMRSRISNLAVLETRPGRGRREAVRRLSQALAAFGTVRLIDESAVDQALGQGFAAMPYGRNEANRELVRWLNEAETEADFLIYTASSEAPTWWRRCLRQADYVLMLADIEDQPDPALPMLDEIKALKLKVPVAALFRRGPRSGRGEPQDWCAALGASAHFYWRMGEDEDLMRVARQLVGVGNGLVLGGGGARGFAHIGLIRALDELGIPLDVFGGSSMGALIAALRASGLNALEIVREMRASFVEKNFLNDYTLPRVGLIRGRRFLARMRDVFGDTRIEDLPAPYFCVSTNLTQGRCEVHRNGPLAMWIATSMAVPGVAPPVAWRGDFLADGAVINALPTDIMRDLGRGPVIASSVSSEGMIAAPGVEGPDPEALFNWTHDTPRPSLFDILFRTATLTSESGNARRAELADVYLRMPVSHVSMFQWEAIDTLVRAGYEFAIRELANRREELMP